METAPTSAGHLPQAGPIPAAWRYPRSGPWTTASDVVIALAFLFLSLIGRPEAVDGPTRGVASALYFLLVGACALAMAVRRHSPLLFVLVAGICLSAHLMVLTDFSIFFVVTGLVADELMRPRRRGGGPHELEDEPHPPPGCWSRWRPSSVPRAVAAVTATTRPSNGPRCSRRSRPPSGVSQ